MIERIGEYKLEQKLGQGGFGAVYKALSQDGQVVAVKILSSEHTNIDHIVQKFFDEAVILARVEHKNIASFIRLVKDGETFAIVMEFVDGFTMKDLIEKRLDSYSFDQRMELAKKALDALIYAHERKIVHRDIKPANIMITAQGDVKVTDFGIARISTIATQGTSSWVSLHYAAPERFKTGSVVDERTDIYSMGVTLYELFTGQKPFAQDDMAEILFSHLNTVPEPPIKIVPALPKHVSAALMRALEKDPRRRFQNSTDFYNALVDGQFSPQELPPGDETIAIDAAGLADKTQLIDAADKTVADKTAAGGLGDKAVAVDKTIATVDDKTIANDKTTAADDDKTIAAAEDKTIAHQPAAIYANTSTPNALNPAQDALKPAQDALKPAPDALNPVPDALKPALDDLKPASKSKTRLYKVIAAAVIMLLVSGGFFVAKLAKRNVPTTETKKEAVNKLNVDAKKDSSTKQSKPERQQNIVDDDKPTSKPASKPESKPAPNDNGRKAADGKKESSEGGGGSDAARARELKDAGLKDFNEKKYKEAAEKLGQSVKINKDPDAYVYLLYSMSFLGDEAGFQLALEEAMKSPNEKIYEMAVKHYLSAGRKDKAAELLDRGLKAYPDNAKLKGLEPLVKG
jgi:predicted Ser/Thr protein kinase/tetratricopeptide (TPR) repeat protein